MTDYVKLDGKLDLILNKVDGLGTRMDRMEDRMESMEGRMESMEGRMENVEGRLENVEGRLESVEGRLTKVEEEVVEVKKGLQGVKLRIENKIEPSIRIIAENHSNLNRKLELLLEEREKREIQDMRIRHLEHEVDRLNNRVFFEK